MIPVKHDQPISVQDAFKSLEVLSELYPPESETVRVNPNLLGRILAENVVAHSDIPTVRSSREHGFATMVDYPGERRRIVGQSTALSPYNAALLPGECVRITIGGVVPEGADTVVAADDVALTSQEEDSEETVEFEYELERGENIREPGSDARAGDILLTDGFKLDSVAIGILYEVGFSHVEVYRKSKVCVLSIGDHYGIGTGKEADISRPHLQAMFHSQGFTAIDAGSSKEDAGDIEEKLSIAAKFSCVIVTIGSVKSVRKVAKEMSLTIDIASVACSPGNFSFAHGNIDEQPVFLCMLSKELNSAWIGANLFVSPMLRAMEGRASRDAPRFRAKLTEPVQKSSKTQFLRGRTERSKSVLTTTPVSFDALIGFNSIIEVPAGTNLISGSSVDVILIEISHSAFGFH